MAIPKNQKNSKYWDLRSEAESAWIIQNIQNDEAFNAKLKEYYDRAILSISRTIEAELAKLAIKENVDINEIKQRVKDFDVQEYSVEAKRVVDEADKLRSEGHEVTYDDFSKEVNERLRLYNATMRINRQELLKSLIGLKLIELGANVDASLRQKLTKDYTDEITRQAGILGEFKHPTWASKEVAKIVMAQTGAATFSKRIWANQDALKARLDAALSVALIQGKNPRELSQQLRTLISKEVTNSRYAAERIARTESARVQTQAQLKSFRDYGYKFCKWHAEPSACKICKEIAENASGYGVGVYRVDEVPSLPAHPNCRCSLGAYWVDEDNFLTTDVNVIRKRLDKYHDDFLEATGINVSDSIRNGTFSDTSNPQNDVKAKFVNYLLEQKGYTQLPKQVKEYSGTKVYRGVHRSIDGKMSADDIDKELRTGRIYISGANSSSKGRGIYFSELEDQARMHAKYGEDFKIFEYGTAREANVTNIVEVEKLLRSVKKLPLSNNPMDSNVDIIAITAGYDIIKMGATLNVLNRGILEWKGKIEAKNLK